MNGDYHPDEPEVDSNLRNINVVKGKQEDCEAACQALLELVPVSEEMEVPYDLRRFIIGQKGRDVRSMMDHFDVSIIIPPQNTHSDVITIKGTPDNVTKTKEALKERIEQLELEKKDRVLKNFHLSFDVDPVHHSKIIGHAGVNVNKISKDFGVNILCPDREADSESTITVIGYEEDTTAAKEHILKLVQEQLQDLKERDFMKQYTHPPSRNGNHDGEGYHYTDKSGFVVKGAPWDKGAVPDTTNVQEFPSFGTGGEMPSKPVAWGPSRR